MMIDDLKIHEEVFRTCLNVLCDSWLAGIFPNLLEAWLSPVSVACVGVVGKAVQEDNSSSVLPQSY